MKRNGKAVLADAEGVAFPVLKRPRGKHHIRAIAKAVKGIFPIGFDPAKPLKKSRHERFCRELLIAPSQADAYLKVYPNSTAEGAAASAPRLLGNVRVQARVGWMLAQGTDDSMATYRQLLQTLSERIRVRFTQYVTTDQDGGEFIKVSKDSPNAAGIKELVTKVEDTGDGKAVILKLGMHDQVPAIALYARLMGWDKAPPIEHHVTGSLTIEMLIQDANGVTRGLPKEKAVAGKSRVITVEPEEECDADSAE